MAGVERRRQCAEVVEKRTRFDVPIRHQILAVGYTAMNDPFVTEKPRLWLAKLGDAVQANGSAWDIAPDGTGVAIVTPVDSVTSKPEHELVFLMNLFDELRRRAPLGR